jgi:hypothetical protein
LYIENYVLTNNTAKVKELGLKWFQLEKL